MSRHRQRTAEFPKSVIAPALSSLIPGQIIYTRISWGKGPDEWKTRPAVFCMEKDRRTALVRPLYSRGTGEEVVVNGRRCYPDGVAEVDKLDIVATTQTFFPELGTLSPEDLS